jgi:hypothetical protein
MEDRMTFNIGSQYGSISNVAGDQTVYGGQHTTIGATPEVLGAIQQIYAQLDRLPVSTADRTNAKAELEGLDRQVAAGQVTQEHVSQRLTRVLTGVRNAGAVLTAASDLGRAITTVAKWLGPIGASLLALLA